MDDILIVVFDSERQAYEGYWILKELHAAGHITLYSVALVWRDSNGRLFSDEGSEPSPTELAKRILDGSLIDLLGPVGTAAAVGVVDRVGGYLQPGQAAVVAEVQEESCELADRRLEAVGGRVYRSAASVAVDDQISRDLAAIRTSIARLETERDRAEGEARAKLGSRIEAARAELQKTNERARNRIEATEREVEARSDLLKMQLTKVRAEQRQQIEARLAEVRHAYRRRIQRLSRYLDHTHLDHTRRRRP